MTEAEMIEIAKWLQGQGYDIDLNDQIWMEDNYEVKVRDLIQLIFDYNKDRELFLTEKLIDKLIEDEVIKVSERPALIMKGLYNNLVQYTKSHGR